ncbi:MAG: envelope stress response membrane protein PspB [Novosphingobium sp.]
MEEIVIPVVAIVVGVLGLLVALPWIILHYITKWKTAATLTTDDEGLLEELYQVARRLDERMDTVERLVAADHPDFERTRLLPNTEADNHPLDEIELRRGQKARSRR